MYKTVLITILALVLPIVALADDEDYSSYPGYVDLSRLDGFEKSDASVEVYIKKPLLKLVAAFNENEDPQLNQLINNLALIRVEQFAIKEDQKKQIETMIDDVAQQLKKENWDKLVRVRDHGEHVEVFLKMDDEMIDGLLVMAMENDHEVAFVNIVGRLDLELLGKLGAKFNIPSLDKVGQTTSEDTEQGEEK